MSKKNNETAEYPSLADIQQALAEVDKKRKDDSLSKKELELLELSAVGLRDAERLAIARLQKSVIKDMEVSTAELNMLAKKIRTKVTRMNRLPKGINKLESVIKVVVTILSAVVKWR